MIRRVFLAVCLLAFPAAAWAEPAAACRWETAQSVSLGVLEGSPARWLGACVRVRGDLDRSRLSLTRRARLTIVETVSVGAYFKDETLGATVQSWRRPRRVEALGAVRRYRDICDEANSAADASEEGVTTFTICTPPARRSRDATYVLIDAIR